MYILATESPSKAMMCVQMSVEEPAIVADHNGSAGEF